MKSSRSHPRPAPRVHELPLRALTSPDPPRCRPPLRWSVDRRTPTVRPGAAAGRPERGRGVDRVGRAGALFPLAVIVLFALMDFAAGPRGVVLGLVVIGPLVAASITGCAVTTAYGVLAFVVAVLLGFYDGQYSPENWPIQAVRLFGVAIGGVIARAACETRVQREARLRQLGADA